MTFRDDSPVKDHRSSWTDLRRRCFQKRHFCIWILTVLLPFVVLRLMVFYHITTPFQTPPGIPDTAASESLLHRHYRLIPRNFPRLPALKGPMNPPTPFVRPDEDAWITHDAWINHDKSARSTRRKENVPTERPTSAGRNDKEGNGSGKSPSVDKDVENFGLPEDNEKDDPVAWEMNEETYESNTSVDALAAEKLAAREQERKEAEEQRKAAEKKKTKNKKRQKEQKSIEEWEKADEERRAEGNKKAEQQKLADEREAEEKKADEARKAEEDRKAEELKVSNEQKAAREREAEDQKRAAEVREAEERKSEEETAAAEIRGAKERKSEEETAASQQREDEEKKAAMTQPAEEMERQDAMAMEEMIIPTDHPEEVSSADAECDLFEGDWEYDEEGPLYTNSTCFYIQGHQNCIKNGRPDTAYLHWRWKPRDCDLPRFDARAFLEAFRGKTLGFVGDSLARNQMQSLLCMLSQVEIPRQTYDSSDDRSVRWLYEQHQVTLAVVWSPYLLTESAEGVHGFENGQSVLYLDVLDTLWTSVMADFDIIVFSVGQWYFKGSVYIKEDAAVGCHYCPGLNLTELGFYDAYREGLYRVLDKVASEFKGVAVMSTFAISHFEHGSWADGECRREKPLDIEAAAIFPGLDDGGLSDIVMEEFNRFAKDKTKLRNDLHLEFLDVTKVSRLRADGHPGPYRNIHPYEGRDPNGWVQNDCLHWCLPGPVDTWNQLLVKILHRYM